MNKTNLTLQIWSRQRAELISGSCMVLPGPPFTLPDCRKGVLMTVRFSPKQNDKIVNPLTTGSSPVAHP